MFKKLLVVLVALIAISGTASAYAWWDNLADTRSETITIGDGETLVVAEVLEYTATDRLVPSGAVLKANDVTSVVLTYNVKLDQTAVTALDLTVTTDNLTVGGVAYTGGLINVVVTPVQQDVNGTDVLVTVTVSLAPDSAANDYSAIQNGEIGFDVIFTATQK